MLFNTSELENIKSSFFFLRSKQKKSKERAGKKRRGKLTILTFGFGEQIDYISVLVIIGQFYTAFVILSVFDTSSTTRDLYKFNGLLYKTYNLIFPILQTTESYTRWT